MFKWSTSLRVLAAAVMLGALAGCPLDGTNLEYPESRSEAHRFLTQATFGPDEANIQRVMAIGYNAWIDEQFATQPAFSYRTFMTQRDAEIKAAQGNTSRAGPNEVLDAFFTRALTDKAQLRSRLAFALSEIFVVSYVDEMLARVAPETVAFHADIIDRHIDGTYRQMLEGVSKSPAMGQYLTFRGNSKEIPSAGRFPDENYAREVMQLFSIGLYELNPDGTLKLDAKGKPIETYNNNDIKGLAKVFTGWSHYRGPAYAGISEAKCFGWNPECRDPEGLWQPMVAYPNFHSVSAKSFLGMTIPAQGTPSPQASLTAALDKLASHPNTAPFISKQLIQRLVTSNPSPAYVGRVAARFTATGGNFKEVVRAILMDSEARSNLTQADNRQGKLREPVLRLTAVLRAFNFDAPTLNRGGGKRPYLSVGQTSDAGSSFGQAPFHSPSVFNFFRPGYTPPQSQMAANGLVAPEMQLLHESSLIGYFNAMQDMIFNGIGPNVTATQRNVTMQLTQQRLVARDATALTEHIAERLKGSPLSSALQANVIEAVNSIAIPPDSAGADAINTALNRRVWLAILMVAVSPEFLVTK